MSLPAPVAARNNSLEPARRISSGTHARVNVNVTALRPAALLVCPGTSQAVVANAVPWPSPSAPKTAGPPV